MTMIWGFAFVVVKNSFELVSTGYMLAFRFGIAAITLCIVFARRIRKITLKMIKHGAIIGACLYLAYLSQTYGCYYTTAGKNAFLTTAYVIMVPFLNWLMYKIKPGKKCLVAAVVALTGIGFISLNGDLSMQIGDLLTLVCALFFALQIVLIGKYAKDEDPILMAILQVVFSAIFAWIYAPIVDGPIPTSAFTGDGIIAMLYLGLFSTMICFVLQNVCQKYAPPEACSILMGFEAVFGAIFSAIFLHEIMTGRMFFGCVLMFLAFLIIEVSILPGFYPDERIASAYDIDYEGLYQEGYRGVIFDIDNTLVMHDAHGNAESKELLDRLINMGFKVLFLSNNKEERVKSFKEENNNQCMYIYKAGKPSRRGYLQAMELMGCDNSNTIFIGDQLFTDVWGAKRCNIRNILTNPIHPKEEIQIVLKRILERIVLSAYDKQQKG